MPAPTTPPAPQPVTIDSNLWMRRLAEGDSAPICREMIAILDLLGASRYTPFAAEDQVRVDYFVHLMLTAMCHPNFVIPDEFSNDFVNRNHLISNLVAQSSFKTTDAHLEIIRAQPRNFLKVLSLYSARNTVAFDAGAIFQLNPLLGSMWFMQYSELFHAGLVDPVVQGNLDRLFSSPPAGMMPVCNLQEPYFGASYLATAAERVVKGAINRGIQATPGAPRGLPATKRDPRKVAVASCHWRPNHSCFRIVSAFIEALRPRYHVTFLQLGRHSQQAIEGFDEVRIIDSDRGLPRVNDLLENDFQAIIYPDIGMSSESVILGNLRLAPVQMCLLGHSVSTFGADIDYFISGEQVEVPERPEQHYSERLVLLPGMGCVHNLPLAKRTGRAKAGAGRRVYVSCPWQAHKVNTESLAFLRRVLERVGRPAGEVVFRFFIGAATNLYNDHPPFAAGVAGALPAGSYEIYTDLDYPTYMGLIEECDLSLDSWHFGGCNTVSDALWLGVPIACREGGRWYNRVGPRMLRMAGLGQLVAGTEEAYLELAGRLIGDAKWRAEVAEKVNRADLPGTIYSQADAGAFAEAFDYLIANHESLKAGAERSAIRFPLH